VASVRALSRRLRRSLGGAVAAFVGGVSTVVSRIPTRAALRLFDAMALVLYHVDARGRRAGRQNLRAVFGETKSSRERRRILRGSYRTMLRGVWALLHLQPLDARRFARWVTIDPEDEARMRHAAQAVGSGVLVSGHFGNWELLLASRTAVSYAPRVAYLVEQTPFPEVDRAIDRLRSRGGRSGALRKGGSLALKGALDRHECVGVLVDRNVRPLYGGVYVPFLGLPAATTSMPAFLARRYGRPLSLLLCVPYGKDRWRLTMGPDLMPPPTDDERADVAAALERINEALGASILAQPEAWLWMIKRWKSRPTEAVGRYPAYSYFEPPRPE
jgi:KDO2-lipid IV(A) lauroyltransferase